MDSWPGLPWNLWASKPITFLLHFYLKTDGFVAWAALELPLGFKIHYFSVAFVFGNQKVPSLGCPGAFGLQNPILVCCAPGPTVLLNNCKKIAMQPLLMQFGPPGTQGKSNLGENPPVQLASCFCAWFCGRGGAKAVFFSKICEKMLCNATLADAIRAAWHPR